MLKSVPTFKKQYERATDNGAIVTGFSGVASGLAIFGGLLTIASGGAAFPLFAGIAGYAVTGAGAVNNVNSASSNKQNNLSNFIDKELKSHLLNIKLKRLILKGKVRAQEVANIIYN